MGQVQLVQLVLTLAWSALLLGEAISLPTALASLLVIGSVALTRRAWRADRVPAVPRDRTGGTPPRPEASHG